MIQGCLLPRLTDVLISSLAFFSQLVTGDLKWGGMGEKDVLHYSTFSSSRVDCTMFSLGDF